MFDHLKLRLEIDFCQFFEKPALCATSLDNGDGVLEAT